MLYLVRHAKAGSRNDWTGDDDRLRPLTASGRRQAAALAERLAPLASGVVSSPYVRCVQTLTPLAELLGVEVLTDARLAEAADARAVIDLLATAADATVLCSHGDVIPDTMEALQRRNCLFVGPPEWRKASVWLLRRDNEGTVVEATAWPPPRD